MEKIKTPTCSEFGARLLAVVPYQFIEREQVAVMDFERTRGLHYIHWC